MAKEKNSKKLKIIIAVLLVLLLLSAGALTARVVYLNLFADKSTTTVVTDDIIGEKIDSTSTDSTDQTDSPSSTPATDTNIYGGTESGRQTETTVIELFKGQPSDNENFRIMNMLPGDNETKYFAVKVNHDKNVDVFFNAEVTEQTKALGEVLHIKVTHLENEKVLYDGTFADMNIDGYGETFATTKSTETVAHYEIEVYLPTYAGNEYQAAKLLTVFNWNVLDTGSLDSPQTGDNSDIMNYFISMCCSLMFIILLFLCRRDKQTKYTETN